MEESINRFLKHLEQVQGSTNNTVLAYRSDLHQLDTLLAGKTKRPVAIEELSTDSIADYVDWLSHHAYRPTTVSRKMAAVRSFLNYVDIHEAPVDPRVIDTLRTEPAPRKRPRVLAMEEVSQLLTAPIRSGSPRGVRDATLLSLLYATGLRAAEVVGLKVTDVDLQAGKIARSSGRPPRIELGAILELMRKYLEEARPHLARATGETALFLNQRGKRLSRQGLWLVVKRWAGNVGLGHDISPLTLRHSLADHLLGQGRSRKEVQQMLGLSSPSSIRVLSSQPED